MCEFVTRDVIFCSGTIQCHLDFRKEKKDVIELVVAGANVCVFFKLVENSFHLKNNDDTCKCHVSCFTGDIFASG